jgi:hypothetical protein
MNWGRAQVEAASKCAIDTQMSIVELNNVPEICYGGEGENGVLHFIIENGPNIDIEELQLSIIGAKSAYNVLIKESVQVGFSLVQDIPYDLNAYGSIRRVKISPKIVLYPGEDSILCPEQAIILENIRNC